MKRAFTLIEVLFVLLILGILATIAIPKFSHVLDQADIGKAKSTVSAIRGGIQVYKNKHILLGEEPYPSSLDSSSNQLFDVVLPHGIAPSTKAGGWSKSGEYYIFHTNAGDIAFKYDSSNGTFDCVSNEPTTIENICNNFE